MPTTQDYTGLVSRLKFLTLPTATPDTANDYLVFLDATTGDLARALWPSGGGGGVSDGDKGDITVSSSGTVWNIDAGVVTTTELGGDITTAGKALLDDADAAAQRTTLGLGDSATRNVGTTAGTVAAGDDLRMTNTRTADSILEFGGPTVLAMDAVADGQYLRRSGSSIIGDTPAGGGGGASGTTEVNFGTFPGSSDCSVTVTGQTGIGTGSVVQAWLQPKDTTDHTADEHRLETISVTAGNIVAGTGFTIYAQNTSQLNERLESNDSPKFITTKAAGAAFGGGAPSVGGKGTRIYGVWNVAWRWS